MKMKKTNIVALILMAASCNALAQSQPNPHATEEDVAKKLANPVADLVSVPLQFNWEQGVGPDEEMRSVVNFQPVVPFALTENWNLIGRMILPFINQPSLAPGAAPASGTGDMLLSGFLSPAKAGGAIWGIGPVLSLPMSTDPFLGSGKWSAGPTVVVLRQTGGWTYGALANHLWSFADATDAPRSNVNLTYVQPFLAYTTSAGATYNISSEASGNWEAPSGDKWQVPILLTASKVTRVGPFPFSIAIGGGYYVERPSGGPEWKLRLTATLILPKGR